MVVSVTMIFSFSFKAFTINLCIDKECTNVNFTCTHTLTSLNMYIELQILRTKICITNFNVQRTAPLRFQCFHFEYNSNRWWISFEINLYWKLTGSWTNVWSDLTKLEILFFSCRWENPDRNFRKLPSLLYPVHPLPGNFFPIPNDQFREFVYFWLSPKPFLICSEEKRKMHYIFTFKRASMQFKMDLLLESKQNWSMFECHTMLIDISFEVDEKPLIF